jgi:hypothetical protein
MTSRARQNEPTATITKIELVRPGEIVVHPQKVAKTLIL